MCNLIHAGYSGCRIKICEVRLRCRFFLGNEVLNPTLSVESEWRADRISALHHAYAFIQAPDQPSNIRLQSHPTNTTRGSNTEACVQLQDVGLGSVQHEKKSDILRTILLTLQLLK
jgi:hypothetical protein